MFKKKIDPKNLLLSLFSIGFTLIILEVFLRILFAGDQSVLISSYRDRPYLVKNKYWKAWHYPGAQVKHVSDCFDASYQANSLGLRNEEIRSNSKYRIAFMGDSFVEGYGKNANQIFPHLIDSITGPDIEILNFGASGGIGTVNEVAMYENFVTHFKPDLVVLFYLNYNDVHDNINSLSDGYINEQLEFTYPIGSKEEIFNEIKSQKQPESNPIDASGIYVFRLASKGLRSLTLFLQTSLNMKLDFRTYLAKTYSPAHSDEIQKGYDIAAKSIERFQKLTARDSTKFLLIQLPDPFQLDKNWIETAAYKYDMDIVPDHPNKIVGKICQDLNVPYFNMYPAAKKYIEDNEMKFPYFSHTCDRHPNEFGHQYLANEIHTFLKEKNYLKH